MIGLLRGIAMQVYVESRGSMDERNSRELDWGFVKREELTEVMHPEECYPESTRYYELLDACPLRMS